MRATAALADRRRGALSRPSVDPRRGVNSPSVPDQCEQRTAHDLEVDAANLSYAVGRPALFCAFALATTTRMADPRPHSVMLVGSVEELGVGFSLLASFLFLQVLVRAVWKFRYW